ncbi:MAG: TlpA family protein disulfide reductase, partial [Gemmatimonadales bacterium]
VTSLMAAIYLPAAAGCRDAGPPPDRYTLLFLGRSPAARLGHVTWAPDPARSRLIAFDGELRAVGTIDNPRLASPVAVAALDGRLLVTERTGEGVVLSPQGTVIREWNGPFPASLYATSGTRIVAARSPYFVQFVAEDGGAPLFWVLDTLGRTAHGPGTVHVPLVRYLAQLVNAGPIALGPDAIYYAPLVRDEILRLDATAYPVWRSSRGLFRHETDPLLLADTAAADSGPPSTPRVRVAHALVNIALNIGPDGRLYVLGGGGPDDSAAMRLRLDALDTASGRIVDTRVLGTAATAVAVNAAGGVRILDLDSLLARVPSRGTGRMPFAPPFALPDLAGDTVRLEDYRGKVTLVNFWASWCDPCREEFPHMAELYRELPRAAFAIAAISDDIHAGQMRAFVREFRPPFPILAGGGRMKAVYHYRGLPYSVLLDRRGRVVERIFGFGGAAEFRRLRETIANEIAAPYP